MDLKDMATQMLMSKLGGNADEGAAKSALDNLLGGSEGGSPLAGLVEKFTGGELAGAAKSWLGDGDNESVSADQVTSALGSGQVADFASKLGIDQNQAAEQLSQFLPELVDKTSRGGELLDSIGGLKGLGGLASKFFK
ncbi:MAG: YidB family protein [Gammaproteobacteria bacterium]|nr:YidB family protein [Gammaproteobacteria bacterium]